MRNYILIKDTDCTIFSYMKYGNIDIYLTNEVLDYPLGELKEKIEIFHKCIKLPLDLSLSILKKLCDINNEDKNVKLISEASKKLYDYFLDKEKILRNQPTLIRKVMDIKSAMLSLQDQTIKFTPRDEFNDIQEGYVKYYSGCPIYTHCVDSIDEALDKEMAQYRIACFSEGPWNNLALSLYGDKGNGVLFIFRADELSKQLGHNLTPVTYRYNPPTCNGDNIPSAALKALECKHVSWEYEKEWRYIIKKDQLEALHAKPMEDSKSLLWEFKMDALKKILVGPRVCDDKWKRLCCIVNEKNKSNPGSHVEIYKLGVDRSEYNSLPISCP